MIEAAAGEAEAGPNVFKLQIREFFEDLLGRESVGHQVQDINDPDAHAADARAPATLLRVDGDSVGNISHWFILGQGLMLAPPARVSQSVVRLLVDQSCRPRRGALTVTPKALRYRTTDRGAGP